MGTRLFLLGVNNGPIDHYSPREIITCPSLNHTWKPPGDFVSPTLNNFHGIGWNADSLLGITHPNLT